VSTAVLGLTSRKRGLRSIDRRTPVTYSTGVMKSRFAYLIALTALTLASLCAGPVPITPAQLGPNIGANDVVFGPSGQPEYLVCPTDVSGCGGAFTERIGGINATIWCVDSQLSANWGDTYPAYIEDLNGTPGPFDANHVHYAGVTTAGPGGWSYSLSGLNVGIDPNSAKTRFELAAILISQYQPGASMPDNTAYNQAIQDAIWRLTENNSAQTLTNPNADAWVTFAENSLNSMSSASVSSFFSQWAVVSGGWDPTTFFSGQHQYQTFLVQVTPEPRFYGLLLVGLLSLCGIVYRRRVAA
jgi:hypothetical protein